MAMVLIAVVLMGSVVSIGLFILYRAVAKLRSDLLEIAGPFGSCGGAESTQKSEPATPGVEPVPRQIIHDLNNLLSTIGGFADAAMEDLSDDDPVERDLREISEAARRAKSVVERLREYAPPKPDGANNNPRRSSSSRSITESYQLPNNPVASSRRSSFQSPAARPISDYRKQSHSPPMARPITSEKYYRSSLPASDSATKEGETGRTSTFPVPSSSNVGSERSSKDVGATGKASGVPSSKGGSTPMQECRARLMIVDDEIQLLTMFKRVFEPQGYKVTTFSDSSKALAEFKRNSDSYDLAILDQRMPELTGANLAVQMITQRPDFPIILLTGFSDTVTPDDAARIGIRKYLSKPIRQAKLSETIRNVLQESYGQ